MQTIFSYEMLFFVLLFSGCSWASERHLCKYRNEYQTACAYCKCINFARPITNSEINNMRFLQKLEGNECVTVKPKKKTKELTVKINDDSLKKQTYKIRSYADLASLFVGNKRLYVKRDIF